MDAADFETMHGLKNRVSSTPTSPAKSLVENVRAVQPPTYEEQRFGETCTSTPACCNKLGLAQKGKHNFIRIKLY